MDLCYKNNSIIFITNFIFAMPSATDGAKLKEFRTALTAFLLGIIINYYNYYLHNLFKFTSTMLQMTPRND